jgi:hypothetical protein
MNFDKLVELELAQHDWPNIRALNGDAADTPITFRLLLASQNEKEVEAAYWMLENYVVVQGRLSEAALHCVPVICAALVDSTRSNLIRGWLLELLFQIVHGFTSPQDKAGGLAGLVPLPRRGEESDLDSLPRVGPRRAPTRCADPAGAGNPVSQG